MGDPLIPQLREHIGMQALREGGLTPVVVDAHDPDHAAPVKEEE